MTIEQAREKIKSLREEAKIALEKVEKAKKEKDIYTGFFGGIEARYKENEATRLESEIFKITELRRQAMVNRRYAEAGKNAYEQSGGKLGCWYMISLYEKAAERKELEAKKMEVNLK